MTARLEEIRARLASATPGPWTASHDALGDGIFTDYVHGPQFAISRHYGNSPARDHDQMPADADLIANAPTDLAWLLDVAEKSAALLEALRAEPLDAINYALFFFRQGDRAYVNEADSRVTLALTALVEELGKGETKCSA